MTIERANMYRTARVNTGARKGEFVGIVSAIPLPQTCDTDRPDAIQFRVSCMDGREAVYSDAELCSFCF